jgi:hypothetical protein
LAGALDLGAAPSRQKHLTRLQTKPKPNYSILKLLIGQGLMPLGMIPYAKSLLTEPLMTLTLILRGFYPRLPRRRRRPRKTRRY